MGTIRYTKEHEWVRLEGEEAVVGITDYAQSQLGDVVFVELPEVGRELAQGDEAAVVESVKAASEVYAPLSGTVTAVNERLPEEPGLVNTSPMEDGWFFRMKPAKPAELDALMDEDAYKAYVAELEG
ncbi:MAG: glycine cleavage system H protein [Rhodothalassiaceae bacterium]|nr:MAG: glycine cleavage system H protein [Rhodothalassiaceae bacterium]